jgi:hypothetical protein
METKRWQYPGDPAATVTIQSGREFLASQPRPREIVVLTEISEEHIPMGDQMLCDACNVDLSPDDWTALSEGRLYCRSCYDECIHPYLLTGQ